MAGQRNDYGKRYHSHGDYSDSGGSKRRNSGDDSSGSADTVYRILCPGRKIGSIIGRGGEIVKQLRADTQAKIRIGETVHGCDERVITIYSSDRETRTIEDIGEDVCPAQDALFKVLERLTDESPNDDDANVGDPKATVRILVPSDQIGCIIGKGGQIVQGIRSDTGAHIRILKNDHLPACALNGDELVQISGDIPVLRKALFQISSRLHRNPSRSQHLLSSGTHSSYAPVGHYGLSGSGAPVMAPGPVMASYGGYKGDVVGDWSFYPGSRDESSSRDFGTRLLCPSSYIGGVIGKGGVVIKQIRQESGATIKVDSSTVEEDCIISISAREFFEDGVSPTIEAAVRLQPRCSEKIERDAGDASYTTRLLVPTSRIGCLIGKGGSIISELRRSTRANIRILSKESLPKVASDDDEMVQISGDLDLSRNALIQVLMRLKANVFDREGAVSAIPSMPYHSISSDVPDGSKYGGRDSKLSGRGYSGSGGYSSYSGGGYSSSGDFPPSGSYGGYGSNSQVRMSKEDAVRSYSSYGGYSGRSGGSGFSGPNSLSHGKHHGY